MDDNTQNTYRDEEEKEESTKLNKILVIIIIIVAILIVIFSVFLESDFYKYKKGNKFFVQKDYNTALDYYSKIENYKDSKNYIGECYFNLITESISNKEYEKTSKYLDELKKYGEFSEHEYNSNVLLAQSYYKDGYYQKSLNILKEIDYSSNKELQELYKLSIIGLAKNEYKNGNFQKCIDYFNEINVNDELKTNAENLLKFQGTYSNGYVISGWKLYVKYKNFYSTYVKDFNLTYNNNKIEFTTQYNYFIITPYEIFFNYSTTIKNDSKYELELASEGINFKSTDKSFFVKKISNSTEKPKENIVLEPKIGMTANEVENSTWGRPDKINKDTYSWGTTEQWVYGNGRYIYFRNGKVSSISE